MSVLIEIDLKSLKLYYVFYEDFVEHLKKQGKYPIKIIRKVSDEEQREVEKLESYLYEQVLSFYS